MTIFWMVLAILGWASSILLFAILVFVLIAFGAVQSEYQELEKKHIAILEQKKSSTSVWALRKEVPFSD
jgi:hypothetical protein